MTTTNAAAVFSVCLTVLAILVCFRVLGRRAVTGGWGRVGAGGSLSSLVGLGRNGLASREGWGNTGGGGGLVFGTNATDVNESGDDAGGVGGGDSKDVGSSGESGGG